MRFFSTLIVVLGLTIPAHGALRSPEALFGEVERCGYMSHCPSFVELMKWRALIAPMLIEKLASSRYSGRFFAERGLKQLGVDAVPHLIQALSTTNVSLRRRIMSLLADVGNSRAFVPLAKMLDRVSSYD